MVVRKEDQSLIHLSEISIVIIESTAVYISSYLLARLAEERIPVIFCDTRHNPVGQYMPINGAFDSAGRLFEQLDWAEDVRGALWQRIVQSKIRNQASNLAYAGKSEESALLEKYVRDVQPHDVTNREGHAAKVYFNALFGQDFARSQDNTMNAQLDYGYAVLLAWFNREIAARGYVGRLGLHHRGEQNNFNLGCDFMEAFRPYIDRYVIEHPTQELETKSKAEIVDLFNRVHSTEVGEYRISSLIGLYVKTCTGILGGRLDMGEYMEFKVDED